MHTSPIKTGSFHDCWSLTFDHQVATRDVLSCGMIVKMFFALPDVPFGLQTAPQVTTIVGNNVRLTCRASKYIYSHLGWYSPSSEAAPADSLIRNTNNYSISLTLVITNVTKEQSGLYRCRAQNQHNSTDTLEQHTQLLVRGTSCQWKVAMGCGGVLLHLLLPLMPFKHACGFTHITHPATAGFVQKISLTHKGEFSCILSS